MASVSFETLFSFYYLAAGFPTPIVAVQFATNLVGLLGLLLVFYSRFRKQGAQLLVGGLFFSLIGPGIFTGGINSSSLVWLVFVPMMATIISGESSGLVWAFVSVVSALGFYFANDFLQPWLLRPTENIDRVVDLVFAIISAGMATMVNEKVKEKFMMELDDAQARLGILANIDPLTNIYNRRYFMLQSEAELDLCQTGEIFSILIFDIDHFKKVNDQHGHMIGDQVLKGIVLVCATVLRKGDLFARLGGEEFVILFPGTTDLEAREVAERLRETIEKTPLDTENGPIRITISIGISACSATELTSLQEIIRRADVALYSAKDAGRNKVISWQELMLLGK